MEEKEFEIVKKNVEENQNDKSKKEKIKKTLNAVKDVAEAVADVIARTF